jgi:hypothetical protein
MAAPCLHLLIKPSVNLNFRADEWPRHETDCIDLKGEPIATQSVIFSAEAGENMWHIHKHVCTPLYC